MQDRDSISIFGAGSWGTALAFLLCENFSSVYLWGRDTEAMLDLTSARCNQKYLPDQAFPKNLHIRPCFKDAVYASHNFLVVVPSHAFRSLLVDIKHQLDTKQMDMAQCRIVWATKGLDEKEGGLLSDLVLDILGESMDIGVISGPSFAQETALRMPTALTLACQNEEASASIANWFITPTTRVYFSCDLVGVQLGGAIKNVIAIAAGISDGLGFGANARAALITRGLSEISRLGVKMGGRPETFMGLTGMGDLILTCTDNHSRNRRFGLGLGKGLCQDSVIKEIGQEIEGINTTKTIWQLSKKLGVEMPISQQVYNIVHLGMDPAKAVQNLLSRDPKMEPDFNRPF